MTCKHERTKWTIDFSSGSCSDCGMKLRRNNLGKVVEHKEFAVLTLDTAKDYRYLYICGLCGHIRHEPLPETPEPLLERLRAAQPTLSQLGRMYLSSAQEAQIRVPEVHLCWMEPYNGEPLPKGIGYYELKGLVFSESE